MTMRERIAKVIGDHMWGDVHPERTPNLWPMALSVADLVLETMREPTDKMVLHGVYGGDADADTWRQMIDAAKAETVEKSG